MTPTIGTSLPLPGDEAVKLDKKYAILEVKEFTSDVQLLKGWRVTLDGGKDALLALPLWEREIASPSSKLGAFLDKLGNETDAWINKVIIFKSWTEKKREIEVVK